MPDYPRPEPPPAPPMFQVQAPIHPTLQRVLNQVLTWRNGRGKDVPIRTFGMTPDADPDVAGEWRPPVRDRAIGGIWMDPYLIAGSPEVDLGAVLAHEFQHSDDLGELTAPELGARENGERTLPYDLRPSERRAFATSDRYQYEFPGYQMKPIPDYKAVIRAIAALQGGR